MTNGNRVVNLYDVAIFSMCNCELSITFTADQHYFSINDIGVILEEVGLHIGNFFFKGLSAYDFTEDNRGKLIPRREYIENGKTRILCMIPENIRDIFTVFAEDTNAILELPY
jgi:hypothetical protein